MNQKNAEPKSPKTAKALKKLYKKSGQKAGPAEGRGGVQVLIAVEMAWMNRVRDRIRKRLMKTMVLLPERKEQVEFLLRHV